MRSRHRVELFIDSNTIQKRVNQLADEIRRHFQDEPLLAICVLKGALVFFTDLIRALQDYPLEVDFLSVKSYQGTQSSGQVQMLLDLTRPIQNHHVLLVEDIVDTGLTLDYIKKLLLPRNPKSLKVVSLLVKPESIKIPQVVDFVGFEIPNKFVVGYGMDYDGYWRNLPYIGVLNPEN